ncbi:hypothetical protein [Vampirovibrio sp.]|uniref:hypothetical protein n=1 Tax=Vampirovibrio sp. TaxID=2717857 RepID=UPI0035940A6F
MNIEKNINLKLRLSSYNIALAALIAWTLYCLIQGQKTDLPPSGFGVLDQYAQMILSSVSWIRWFMGFTVFGIIALLLKPSTQSQNSVISFEKEKVDALPLEEDPLFTKSIYNR